MARSSYLQWNDALKMLDYFKAKNNPKGVALMSLGIFSGLRIGDILSLQWKDLGSKITLIEEKTGKKREVSIQSDVLKLLDKCKTELFAEPNDKIIEYTPQHTSRILKQAAFNCGIRKLNVSNHSLRKTFGRAIFENNGSSDEALIRLSEIFGHSSIAITRIYLGITSEEISQCYLSLSLKPMKKTTKK